MIFGEVNAENNSELLIDLACLESQDAQAICKQKIYDLGKALRENQSMHGTDEVLAIIYSEDHVIPYEEHNSG